MDLLRRILNRAAFSRSDWLESRAPSGSCRLEPPGPKVDWTEPEAQTASGLSTSAGALVRRDADRLEAPSGVGNGWWAGLSGVSFQDEIGR